MPPLALSLAQRGFFKAFRIGPEGLSFLEA
jgi:hypothetical protein